MNPFFTKFWRQIYLSKARQRRNWDQIITSCIVLFWFFSTKISLKLVKSVGNNFLSDKPPQVRREEEKKSVRRLAVRKLAFCHFNILCMRTAAWPAWLRAPDDRTKVEKRALSARAGELETQAICGKLLCEVMWPAAIVTERNNLGEIYSMSINSI